MKPVLRAPASVFKLRRRRRKWLNGVMIALMGLCVLAALIPLVAVFVHVLREGLPALNWDFFTQLPKPVGETGGGMANALLGSLLVVAVAAAIGVPWGLATGVFLSEYARSRFAKPLRFVLDLLLSVPSIVIGLFAYGLLVRPMQGFSALAGGVALAFIMLPIISRATEEMLRQVPDHIREAGLALGLPRWKVILRIVLRGSWGGVVTGIMLALARGAGETAPLLFTAFNNSYWPSSLTGPTATLPVYIFNYAISPFEDWHRQAWAAAFLLLMMVFAINLTTRLLLYSRNRGA